MTLHYSLSRFLSTLLYVSLIWRSSDRFSIRDVALSLRSSLHVKSHYGFHPALLKFRWQCPQQDRNVTSNLSRQLSSTLPRRPWILLFISIGLYNTVSKSSPVIPRTTSSTIRSRRIFDRRSRGTVVSASISIVQQ